MRLSLKIWRLSSFTWGGNFASLLERMRDGHWFGALRILLVQPLRGRIVPKTEAMQPLPGFTVCTFMPRFLACVSMATIGHADQIFCSDRHTQHKTVAGFRG